MLPLFTVVSFLIVKSSSKVIKLSTTNITIPYLWSWHWYMRLIYFISMCKGQDTIFHIFYDVTQASGLVVNTYLSSSSPLPLILQTWHPYSMRWRYTWPVQICLCQVILLANVKVVEETLMYFNISMFLVESFLSSLWMLWAKSFVHANDIYILLVAIPVLCQEISYGRDAALLHREFGIYWSTTL